MEFIPQKLFDLYLHYIAFLQFQIAARIYDDVRQAVPLFTDVVIVDRGQVQRLHPGAYQICDLRSFNLLNVVVSSFVSHSMSVLFYFIVLSFQKLIFRYFFFKDNDILDWGFLTLTILYKYVSGHSRRDLSADRSGFLLYIVVSQKLVER